MAVDENFFDVFQLTLLRGRGFSKDIAGDSSNLIVNETALKTMNMTLDNAVGQSITLWGNKGMIIGVVKDFNFRPLQQSIEPLLIRYNHWGGIAVVRTQPQQTEATIGQLENIFKTLNPGYPFSYAFVDQELDKMYTSELRLSKLFTIFAALAVFISCLGLYGLSAFLAERRTKEIGIRKVLGASITHIVYLLSKTFTKPIIIAMAIATPLSWYAMDQWLGGFAFHVQIDWRVFALAFLVSLAIAWVTVSFESVRAAITDPAKSLKDE